MDSSVSSLPFDRESERLDDRVRFHEPHLARVSRSFSYGISRLEKPLRAAVGLAYLVCRILDTIEDAPWTSVSQQEQAFQKFNRWLLLSPEAAGSIDVQREIQAWRNGFPTEITEGERCLLADVERIISEFASLGSDEKASVLQPVLSMSRGMNHYAQSKSAGGDLVLRDLSDVNIYCFFVAGLVGELLTSLAVRELRPIGLNSIHFGLFLQKINLLKDQFEDEKSKRFLVPDRAAVLNSVFENAVAAFDYLKALPLVNKDYRLFCAWALFLGLATLPLLKDASADRDPVKLPRLQALGLAARVEASISNNERLQEIFDHLLFETWSVPPVRPKSDVEADRGVGKAKAESVLASLYSGGLEPRVLAEILVR